MLREERKETEKALKKSLRGEVHPEKSGRRPN